MKNDMRFEKKIWNIKKVALLYASFSSIRGFSSICDVIKMSRIAALAL
jgi:hypothetical protein